MLIKKGLIILFCSVAIIAETQGQQPACSLTLKGSIRLSDSVKSNLSAVSVYVLQIKKEVAVDRNGDFVIPNSCSGTFSIKISYVGYRSIDTSFVVQSNISFGFLLVSQTQQLTGVTVTAQILHKDEISIAVRDTIGGLSMQETRGMSLGEALKSIAGVNSLQTGPNISKPVIHGVYSNRILIINNGVRQEGQTWGNDHAPEIDPFIATKYTVIKGPASIRYGSDAIGGVVLVDSKDMPKEPGVDGNINLVGMTNGHIGVASGMVEEALGGNLEGLSWRLQGTIKKAGNAQTANYYLGNTGFNEDDYSATLQYNKTHFGAQFYYSQFNTKIGIADASVVGSVADLYQAFARDEPAVKSDFSYDIQRPYQTVRHQLYKTSAFVDLPNDAGKIE